VPTGRRFIGLTCFVHWPLTTNVIGTGSIPLRPRAQRPRPARYQARYQFPDKISVACISSKFWLPSYFHSKHGCSLPAWLRRRRSQVELLFACKCTVLQVVATPSFMYLPQAGFKKVTLGTAAATKAASNRHRTGKSMSPVY